MMVTFVSQCEKKALSRTRKVLDAFADRIGDNTWQTVITQEGLLSAKKALRRTASKNTAVSCHWLRSRSRTELVWVVGNRNKFNAQGLVPVNYTETEIDKFMDKNQWQTINVIQYAAAIAGLFHDFGKANVLFQQKLEKGFKGKKYEPFRHEWVSLRLFQAFVGDNRTDAQWLTALSQVENSEFPKCFKDGRDGDVAENHPINNLPPFAQLVGWLILTHHKLPIYPKQGNNAPKLGDDTNQWFSCNFEAAWNSPHCKDEDQKSLLEKNWTFEKGLPVDSMQWRSKACLIASEASTRLRIQQCKTTNWLDDQLFTTHLSRLCLMLSDHYYSSQDPTPEWQNPNYQAIANTDRKTKEPKQQLDEHLIGVAVHAQKIANALPKLNASLRSLDVNKVLSSNVDKQFQGQFGWQDKAKNLAQKLGKTSITQGFFGINMASTGKGKTLGNAKIMYALGSETGRRRFSVALGLRTLTLQTGREYRTKLELTNEELAIMVGGIAVKQLFENEQNAENTPKEESNQEAISPKDAGSESQQDLLDHELYLDYNGDIDEHSLSQWTKGKDGKDGLEKLLQAPILVSTIDHLMPATEGTKGGKQIAPMLRLLTSDLVLDEPDDFGLDDLPALCRLVHWAGMLGSRVLLSTATMPPALANALFQAYWAGWEQYALVNIEKWDKKIICAWFDEFDTHGEQVKNFDDCDDFKKSHIRFTQERIKKLKEKTIPQNKGSIIPVNHSNTETIAACMAGVIRKHAIQLHQNHHQSSDSKNISIGLVRMANINRLVAVAKEMLGLDTPQDTCIHYCVYHSRYPLAIRSHLENKLDEILNRKEDNKPIWKQESIQNALKKEPQKSNHIFIVLASPVAEVGRDHDYDWAIIEPSSMRSIIQIAGRVLRHRNDIPETPNILLLNKNYKALLNKPICFERPGFESDSLKLTSHDLYEILDKDQYQNINAMPRITLPDCFRKSKKGDEYTNLSELEHKALASTLFGEKKPAKVWWESTPHWCGEVQRQQRFRNSAPDEAYYLWVKDKDILWKCKNEHVFPPKFGEGNIKIITNTDNNISLSDGNHFWFDLDPITIYDGLAVDFSIDLDDLEKVSKRFGEVRLIDYGSNGQEYTYHPNLGLYQEK